MVLIKIDKCIYIYIYSERERERERKSEREREREREINMYMSFSDLRVSLWRNGSDLCYCSSDPCSIPRKFMLVDSLL